MGKFIDLSGRKFGRLTVITRAEDYITPKGQKKIQWLCECSCINKTRIVVSGTNLKSKNTRSCGCLQSEITSNRSKKYNTYDLSGEYGIGYTNNGEKFYFDLEDYDKIKDYCWCINNDGYIVSNKQLLSRLIMDISDQNYDIDHIHGKESRCDNRKSNLRMTTRSQNNMNKNIIKSNTSGATGVTWNKTNNKWIAQIFVNRKHLYLGSFTNFEDAVKARKQAEEKYFGEYSYDSSMKQNINNQ